MMSGWTAIYYEDEHGHAPVKEWLKSLAPKEQAAMLRLVDLLEQSGTQLRQGCKHVEGTPLWALKEHFGGRIFYIRHGEREFVLLHGYRKKGDKHPPKEITIAIKRYHEVMEGRSGTAEL